MDDSTVELVEVLEVDDVIAVVDDTTATYRDETGSKLDGIADTLADVKASADAATAALTSDGSRADVSYTVVLNDDQWQTVRECWGWAKNCAALGLFLCLVCTLICAALLGNRLWAGFSEGWRHG